VSKKLSKIYHASLAGQSLFTTDDLLVGIWHLGAGPSGELEFYILGQCL
jgi:hypothetical protein